MAIPTSRKQFTDLCLRRLGAPVIEINVSPEQIEDRVDEALKYYYDYHFDGSEKVYYKHQITAQNMVDKYIQIPENIMGVVSIFDLGAGASLSSGMFSPQYQWALNNMHDIAATSIVPYYMSMQHLQLLQDLLIGKQPIRYNRHVNKLHIDMNWSKIQVGQYIVVEAYQVVDPEVYVDVWNDRWLQRYAATLIGIQWASNLSKYSAVTLPGGATFNAESMLSRYLKDQDDLEREMIFSFSLPVSDLVGW